MMFFSAISKAEAADTLEFWHVFYNGVKIREYNQLYNEIKEASYKIIKLELDSIKGEDSITVRYGSGTPCPVCGIYRSFYDSINEVVVGRWKNFGLFCPVSFRLKPLTAFLKSQGKNMFEILNDYPLFGSKADFA